MERAAILNNFKRITTPLLRCAASKNTLQLPVRILRISSGDTLIYHPIIWRTSLGRFGKHVIHLKRHRPIYIRYKRGRYHVRMQQREEPLQLNDELAVGGVRIRLIGVPFGRMMVALFAALLACGLQLNSTVTPSNSPPQAMAADGAQATEQTDTQQALYLGELTTKDREQSKSHLSIEDQVEQVVSSYARKSIMINRLGEYEASLYCKTQLRDLLPDPSDIESPQLSHYIRQQQHRLKYLQEIANVER